MALRSPASSDCAIFFALSLAWPLAGAVAPLLSPTAVAMSASACAQFEAGVMSEDAIGIAQSLATSLITDTAAPLRADARTRIANSGWSLRRFEPITSALCRLDSDAIEVPSQRTPSGCGNCALRRR